MKIIVLAITMWAILFSQSVSAATYQGQLKITTLRGVGQSIVWVRLDTQPAGTCSNWGEYMTFDSSTTNGKALLSGLMLAIAAGSTFDIWYIDSTAPGSDQTTGCDQAAMAQLLSIRLRS